MKKKQTMCYANFDLARICHFFLRVFHLSSVGGCDCRYTAFEEADFL